MRALLVLLLFTGAALAQNPQTPLPPVDTPTSGGPGPPDTSPGPPETAPPPQQPAPRPPPTPAAPEEPQPPLWIGPQLDLLPIGTIHLAAFGMDASDDASSAFGIGGLLDYRAHRYFTIGFAPRFVLPVKVDGADDSGNELDLRARATGGGNVTPSIRIYGIGTLGYSWIFNLLTDLSTGKRHTTSGLTLGLGPGISYAINPRMMLVGEVTYEWGFQRTTISSVRVEADASYLSFGVGILFPLM